MPPENTPVETTEQVPASTVESTEDTNVDEFIKTVQEVTSRSLDEITSLAYNSSQPQIPLGDELTLPPPQSSEMVEELDALQREVDAAQNEDPNASPEAIKNFKGLKTRYSNNIEKYKANYKAVTEERDALREEIRSLRELSSKAEAADDFKARLDAAEAELAEARSRNEQLSHYQKKYDFENDPLVRQTLISPMQETQARAMDIIENNHQDESFWKELIDTESEYQLNSTIDAAGIDGMNAQSLKSYVNQYRSYQRQFDEASNPENIDAAISQMRGKSLRISDERAGNIFENMKASFSDHIKEIRESEINKEHNIFVYDQVVADSKKRFDQFRQILGPQYQSDKVLALLAQSAIMAAAYPLQSKYVEHVMGSYKKLLTEVSKSRGSTPIRQTTEAPSPTGFLTDVESIKRIASKSLDDIARGN